MCGIAGIYNLDQKPVKQEDLKKMTDLMIHRGPDDQGFYLKNNLGLGHRRLSIIDLSLAGHQPMSNQDKTIWIIHNGEIYNYLELKKELIKLGYKFSSQTDTEVIIHAYEQWGEECFKKFNGMWAMAIWDEKKQKIVLSRDRFGIKPLYYYIDNKIIAFASEIKPLLTLEMPRLPNNKLIYDFLKFGVLDHTNETFFLNINKIPPAHFVTINQNGHLDFKKYWDFNVINQLKNNEINDKIWAEKFLKVFTEAVKIRLRSDVPIGSCLSGGLDSSSIVCVVNQLLKKQGIKQVGNSQKTFSSCFDDLRFDERKYIEEVIKQTGAEKNYIFPSPENFIKELDKFVWQQEEPVRGTSMYAQYKVFEMAKNKKVTVLLDGQGGDELLAGYRKFHIFFLKLLLKQKKYFSFLKESLFFFLSLGILKTLNLKSGLRYTNWGRKFLNLDALLQKDFSEKFEKKNISIGFNNDLGQRLKDDLTKWSLPVLLRYEDKNSMAHSLETRLPFLDYRLIELAAKMPLNQKIRNGWTKYILRNALKNILPKKIRLRKSKLGFVTPEEIWFKSNLAENVSQTFKQAIFLPNYVLMDKLENNWRKYLKGKSVYSHDIYFRFFILEKWAKIFNVKK